MAVMTEEALLLTDLSSSSFSSATFERPFLGFPKF
jgi:hypothetical protein